MSDFTIPLRGGQVPSLFGAMQQYGQAQQSLLAPLQTQQQTALIGQQVQAARIQNLRAGLQFALADQLYNSIGGSGGGGYNPGAAAPGSPAGVGPPPDASAVGPAGGSPLGQAAPPGSAPGAGGTVTPGSAPGAGPQNQPQQPPALGRYTVPAPDLNNGAAISPFGTPAPRVRLMMAMLSDNPGQQMSQIFNDGRQRVTQVMSFAQTPQQIRQAAYRLYGEGWLDRDQYASIYANPTTAARQQLLDAQASPDAQMSRFTALTQIGVQKDPNSPGVMVNPESIAGQAALAGAKKQAEVVPTVQIAQAAPFSRGPLEERVNPPIPGQPTGRTGDLLSAKPMTAADYASRVAVSEGAGSPASNPNVVAGFAPATWLEQMRQNRPDLTRGLSDAQVLALRSNPQLASQMTTAYATENAPQLQAMGQPVNATTLRLSHWFGPSGAQQVLQAPPGTQLGRLFPAQTLQDNGLTPATTTNQLVGRVVSDYGVAPVMGITPGTAAQAAAGASGAPTLPGAAAPGSPGPDQGLQPLPGGGSTLAPATTPTAQLQAANLVTRQGSYKDKLMDQSAQATLINSRVQQMQVESQNFGMGKFADFKGDALSWLDGVRSTVNQMAGTQVLPPIASLDNWIDFNKNALETVREAVRATSARAAVQEFAMIQKALPSATMSSGAFAQISTQMQGINDWYQAKALAASQMAPGQDPLQFDSQWNNTISPTAFMVHRMTQPQLQALVEQSKRDPGVKAMLDDATGQIRTLERSGYFKALGTIGQPVAAGTPPAPQ